MAKIRPTYLPLIALLLIIGGIYGVIVSFPSYSLYNSIKQGGLIATDKVAVLSASPNSPAVQAQLKKGDTIFSVNGTAVKKPSDLTGVTNANRGKEVSITFERDGNTQTVQLVPRVNPPQDEGGIGLTLTSGVDKKPLFQIIPQVVIRNYSGYEESPVFYGVYTSPWQDSSFIRLRGLFGGILALVVGFGLWKIKKWAIYGYLLLVVYGISAFVITSFALYSVNQLFTFDNLKTLIGECVSITIQILVIIYLFSKRKSFT